MTAFAECLAAGVRALNAWTGAIPQYEGTFCSSGLGLENAADAQILRDENGIPTVLGSTANDIFALHGVCLGQDRLWQLHQTRMAACGRLAEINAKALKFDVFARQIGFGRLGAEDWENIRGEEEHAASVQMLEAFVRGINWAARSCRRAHGEMFMLTGTRWNDLTAAEVCAMARLVSFYMSSGYQHVLVRQWMEDVFGPAGDDWTRTADLSPANPPTLTNKSMSEAFANLSTSDLQWSQGPPMMRSGQGSNWFIVDSNLSSTGKPLLAADPHLKVAIPDFWYQIAYKGALNVTGLTPAVLPGHVVAHNGSIAWSVTLGYTDVEDLYLERFDERGRYEHKGEWKEPMQNSERLYVRGQAEPTLVTVTRTVHGPILEDSLERLSAMAAAVSDKLARGPPQAEREAAALTYKLAYAGLTIRPRSKVLAGVLPLLKAQNFAEFDAALSYTSQSIALNFGFASGDGHIGYVMCGEVPVGRGKPGDNTMGGDEWYPLCGWSGEHDYDGWLPHKQLPKALDPPDGVLVSANHRVVDYDIYPHYLGLVFKSSYRAQAIHEELFKPGREVITLADMKATQQSVLSLAAREFVEVVGAADASVTPLARADADRAKKALQTLSGWDGRLAADSAEAALYQVMHARLVSLLLSSGVACCLGKVPDVLLERDEKDNSQSVLNAIIHGSGNDNVYKMVNELQGHLHNNLVRMLQAAREGDAAGSWWVCAAGGFDTCVARAALLAEDHLSTLADRTWGQLHATTIAHPLTAALGFTPGTFLDHPPLAFGGDTNTPAQVANRSLDDLSGNGSHQSARCLFDLSDLASNSWIITPLGPCEVAGAPHQMGNTGLWHAGGYRRLLWRTEEICARAKYRLQFVCFEGQEGAIPTSPWLMPRQWSSALWVGAVMVGVLAAGAYRSSTCWFPGFRFRN